MQSAQAGVPVPPRHRHEHPGFDGQAKAAPGAGPDDEPQTRVEHAHDCTPRCRQAVCAPVFLAVK